MAKAFQTWTVLPHKALIKDEPNLWHVEGKLKTARRVMTVARYDDGGLLIHNAIALEEDLMKELEAFGTPKVLIVPNGFHRQDAFIWKQRYPSLRVFCPAGEKKAVAQVVAVDGDYRDVPRDASVQMDHLDGMRDKEGVLRVKSGDHDSLVFNDVFMNMGKVKGVMGLMLAPTGRLAVPRAMRWFYVKDKRAFADHVRRLATPSLKRAIVSHGDAIEQGAPELLQAALGTLDQL